MAKKKSKHIPVTDATVQWHPTMLRWVVGLGTFWSGERMTRSAARREANRRNKAGEKPKES